MTERRFVINARIELEETRHYEFKEVTSSNPLSTIKNTCDDYVVAFLNGKGGRIFWGIRNADRHVVGVSLSYEQRDELRRVVTDKLNQIRPAISPAAYEINLHDVYEDFTYRNTVPDRYIVEIIAPRVFSSHLYSTASGEHFIKTDSGKRKLTLEEIQDVITRRTTFGYAQDAFAAIISRNFLFEFEGPDSDYLKLLSNDLRRLFFRLFNKDVRFGKNNRLIISGREGSGKSFNTLLLSLQLSREGYQVFYCNDIRNSSLTPDALSAFADRNDRLTILIVDNTQTDIAKAEDLVAAISRAESYADSPIFLFLTRPLDEDTLLDTFGHNTSVLRMVDKFIDFEYLVRLFFQKRGKSEEAATLLKSECVISLPSHAFGYRNMAFWNEVLRSLSEGTSQELSEEYILMRAHAFFRRKEPNLLAARNNLAKLLPLFGQGLVIHLEYAQELLGERAGEVLLELEQNGLIRIVEQDWESNEYISTSVLVVTPCLHATKAKLLIQVFRKYYAYSGDPRDAVADYAERFPQNLYYILSSYGEPHEIRFLFSNTRILTITRRYFLERHLGKKLDRVIGRLSTLDEATRDSLLDAQVIDVFERRINAGGAYLVSKMYFLRALYRADPKKASELLKRLSPDVISDAFLNDPTEAGIFSLGKSMEVLKNIYYLANPLEAKEAVQSFVRHVLDRCRTEFVRRFTARDVFFTQLHWLLKRLHGLRLAGYFLEGIAPETLVQLIRTKDTNIVELAKSVLVAARFASCTGSNGVRQSYYDILKESLSYDDLKRIFDNKRSDFVDLAMNTTHDFVAKALVRYVEDTNFQQKITAEDPDRLQFSLEKIQTNFFFSEQEKSKIVRVVEASIAPVHRT